MLVSNPINEWKWNNMRSLSTCLAAVLTCRNLSRAAQLSPTAAIACQGRFRGTPIGIIVVSLEVVVYLHVGRGPSTRLKERDSLC
jgi:hypothetical protein